MTPLARWRISRADKAGFPSGHRKSFCPGTARGASYLHRRAVLELHSPNTLLGLDVSALHAPKVHARALDKSLDALAPDVFRKVARRGITERRRVCLGDVPERGQVGID